LHDETAEIDLTRKCGRLSAACGASSTQMRRQTLPPNLSMFAPARQVGSIAGGYGIDCEWAFHPENRSCA
jgi:hypothetical protein